MATLQRVQKLVQQLAPAPARQSSTAATSSSTSSLASLQVSQETAALAAERANAKFNVDALHRVMAGEHIATKLKAFKYMQDDPLFRLDFSKIKSQEEHREWVNQVLKKIAASRVFSLDELETAPMKMADALDAFSYLDGSVSVKIGVHYGLWGSSIFNLASEEQKAKYMKDTDLLNIVGCFALTELKHGSNAAGIETKATYDHSTKEFIIDTGYEGAMKWWIGGAASTAHFSIVFAQLTINNEEKGVHGFIVQLRDVKTNKLKPGIYIGDCGPKQGLNGVDNGFIYFDKVRVPRDNLLMKYSQVDDQGKYISEIKR